jgi:hypothetical protein
VLRVLIEDGFERLWVRSASRPFTATPETQLRIKWSKSVANLPNAKSLVFSGFANHFNWSTTYSLGIDPHFEISVFDVVSAVFFLRLYVEPRRRLSGRNEG